MPQPDLAMDLPPGSIFVHRNLGGLVNHKDLNVMSCLEYALHLGVKHVIICGHYNCGALLCHRQRVRGAAACPDIACSDTC